MDDDHPQDASPTTIIHCWSGPRCVSTSLMYSFAQRDDAQVIDEPLYAHYLRSNPTLHRPYRDEVMASQNSDGTAVLKEISVNSNEKKRIVYVKHMANMQQASTKRSFCVRFRKKKQQT